MNYFHSNAEAGGAFLRTLNKRIDKNEFPLLAEQAGFVDPNTYITVDEFQHVLQSHQFPEENFYGFEWAIYESGPTLIQELSTWIQLFLCALFVYCEKRKQWSIQIGSDYHHLAITLCQEKEDGAEMSAMYLSFLEWLQNHVKPDEEYDDYYCLLAWLMIRRITNTFSQPEVLNVLNTLERRRYTTEYLKTLSDSDAGMESWLDLHLQLPCTEEMEGIFERVILGV